MNVNMQITYQEGDTSPLAKTPTAIAEEVLAALGGDPAKDSCYVQVSATASLMPPPPDPPTVPMP